uniref:chemokine-like protein TAFA-5 isoform X3 n=1 Tax=Scatophagus argus TaxID=75038 RepID=UPI001ED83EF4|nr:chemokine-like protein TAFA-5 isoform X3 [Scatophagus argus]
MQLLRVAWALTGAAICCFLILLIHSRLLKEGQLAAGTCEIVTLDRDSSQPRRTIARQTARCACKKGQIAGTTRARPACVDDAAQESNVGGVVERREKETNSEKGNRLKDALEAERVLVRVGKEMSKERR